MNLRELKTALAQMTECDWRTPGGLTRRVRVLNITKIGILKNVVFEFFLQLCQTRCGQLRQQKDCWTPRPDDAHVDKRLKGAETPVQQESSSGSGGKRSTADVEAMRHADAEAEKALKLARGTTSSQASIRNTCWMSWRTAMNDYAEKSAEAMLVAVDAVLTETRETVEALSLGSPTGSCCEPRCRCGGREVLPSSQGHASDNHGAGSQETARLPGEHERLRGGVR